MRCSEHGRHHRPAEYCRCQCAHAAADKEQQGGRLALHEQGGAALPVHQRPGRTDTRHIRHAQQDCDIQPAACQQIRSDIACRDRQDRARTQPARLVQKHPSKSALAGQIAEKNPRGRPRIPSKAATNTMHPRASATVHAWGQWSATKAFAWVRKLRSWREMPRACRVVLFSGYWWISMSIAKDVGGCRPMR